MFRKIIISLIISLSLTVLACARINNAAAKPKYFHFRKYINAQCFNTFLSLSFYLSFSPPNTNNLFEIDRK